MSVGRCVEPKIDQVLIILRVVSDPGRRARGMTALIVSLEKWMDLRRYRPLRAAGATYREIAAEVGVDWRTVRKYLAVDAPGTPPAAPPRVGTRSRKVDGVAQVIDRWLADDLTLKATVIYERLVADYGFAGHYQRVKMYVAGARERIRLAEGTIAR